MSTRNKYRNKCGGKTHKQKLYKMKGCSKTILRKGGSKKLGSTRKQMQKMRKMRKMKGGCGCGAPLMQAGGSAGLPPLPSTHVSTPWGGSVSQWPGVTSAHGGSWLSLNPRNIDLQTEGIIQEGLIENQFTNGKANPHFVGGGSKKQSRKRKMKGGSLIGNVIQNVQYGIGSMYNTLNGYAMPTNPAPYEQPYLQSKSLIGSSLR
jgi:hypothetical protein